MSKIVRLTQGSPEWHAHRRQYRNASETAAVMGFSPWLTAYQLWELKTGRRTLQVSAPMQRGTDLEPAARSAYEAVTGLLMEPVVMVDGDYSASLDGMSLDGKRIVEIKCPFRGTDSETWQLALQGKVEPHYRFQIQHQLMVSGAEACDFFVFDGKEAGITLEVQGQSGDFEQIRQAWDGFWAFIASDTPPPLNRLDTRVRDDPAWQAAAKRLVDARVSAARAVEEADRARDALASLMTHTRETGCGVTAVRLTGNSGGDARTVRVSISKEVSAC